MENFAFKFREALNDDSIAKKNCVKYFLEVLKKCAKQWVRNIVSSLGAEIRQGDEQIDNLKLQSLKIKLMIWNNGRGGVP